MSPDRLDEIGKWKFPEDRFVYERTILFKQTNALGNTYFANYFEWQGEAREKLLLEHPAARHFMQANPHIALITYAAYHKFSENTYFGDRVRIEVNSRDVEKNSVYLVFRYFNAETNKLIGEGWQKICFSDVKKNQLCSVPQIILDLLEPIKESKVVHT
jgi:enediyne core biosynthesis thioesterase